MPKGGGNKKGKQPAPKAAQKRSALAPGGAGAALGAADLGAILAQIEALERVHGLPPGGVVDRAPVKRGRLTRSAPDLSGPSMSSQIQRRLTAVAEKAASAVVPVAGVDSRPAGVPGGNLVPAGALPQWGGRRELPGEYESPLQLGSWPWGSRSQAAAPGSSDSGLADQGGFFRSAQGRPLVLGTGLGSLPSTPAVAGLQSEGSGDGVGTDRASAVGIGEAPVAPEVPILIATVSPSPGPSQVPVEGGTPGVGAGLLQADVLAQLISAVFVEVAPIAKAAFSSQAEKDPKESDGASGAQKPKEVFHALLWGVSCGAVTCAVGGVSCGDSPMPSGDMAMPLGEHLLQATRDKILRGEYVDVFSLLYREVEKKDKDLLEDREKEALKHRKIDWNWTNWLSGFLVYAGVIVCAHPERAPTILQYLDIIYKVFLNFTS